jgi:hypothetical protein
VAVQLQRNTLITKKGSTSNIITSFCILKTSTDNVRSERGTLKLLAVWSVGNQALNEEAWATLIDETVETCSHQSLVSTAANRQKCFLFGQKLVVCLAHCSCDNDACVAAIQPALRFSFFRKAGLEQEGLGHHKRDL